MTAREREPLEVLWKEGGNPKLDVFGKVLITL